jgi:hypothetical protein
VPASIRIAGLHSPIAPPQESNSIDINPSLKDIKAQQIAQTFGSAAYICLKILQKNQKIRKTH